MTPEGKVTSDCIRLLERIRDAGVPVHWLKVAGGPRQTTGQPDLDICLNGHTIKDELKAPGKDATKLQQHRLAQWANAGATVGVIDSVGGLADQLEPLLNEIGFELIRKPGKPIQVERT